jgi:hypothetical protein
MPLAAAGSLVGKSLSTTELVLVVRLPATTNEPKDPVPAAEPLRFEASPLLLTVESIKLTNCASVGVSPVSKYPFNVDVLCTAIVILSYLYY